jgi:hypothetical protein
LGALAWLIAIIISLVVGSTTAGASLRVTHPPLQLTVNAIYAYDVGVDNAPARAVDTSPAAVEHESGRAEPATVRWSRRSPVASVVAAESELSGTALARQLGGEGDSLIEGAGNTTRIQLPDGGYRIPDILDEAGGVIGEVKNLQSLSYTSQLRDYVTYAQRNGFQFDLYVRRGTQLSGPLEQAIDDGSINLFRVLP